MSERQPWKRLVRDLKDSGFESPYLDRLRARVDVTEAQEQLEREIVREMAGALGRAEEKLLVALLRLEIAGRELDAHGPVPGYEACLARYDRLRRAALEARHELLIHREAVGIRRNQILEQVYPIPPKRR